MGGTSLSLVQTASGSLCIRPDSLPANTRLTENADGSVTAHMEGGEEVRLGRDAAGNLTVLPELLLGNSRGGNVKLVSAAAAIRPEELPAGLKIVTNPDGTYSMTQANSSSGQPITPVRLIKNSDGSFTALPPPPPPPPVAVAALPQLSVKKDGSATVASAPPGFQLVTAPDGGTYLESSLDGTRVAVKHNKDGSLGLTATALGQVMASSSSSSSGVNAVGGGGLLEAAVYNYLYNGGVLPPGVHVETNSDGTVSVTTPPAKGGSSPVVSRLDLRGHRYNGGGGPSSLSAGELVGLERLLTSGGLDAGQLPPGITLVTLSDGSQSVVKDGVPTGTLLSRLANGKLGLQTTTNHNLPLGALLLSGWPVVSGISCSAAVYTSCMA